MSYDAAGRLTQQVLPGGRVVGYRALDKINKTLQPILIRRQKDQVLDQLPERIDKNFFVPMTPGQRTLHEENRENVARIVPVPSNVSLLNDRTCAFEPVR